MPMATRSPNRRSGLRQHRLPRVSAGGVAILAAARRQRAPSGKSRAGRGRRRANEALSVVCAELQQTSEVQSKDGRPFVGDLLSYPRVHPEPVIGVSLAEIAEIP